MTTEAKIGLLVPGCFAGTPPSMQDFTQFFRRADELGFDSLWVIDRIFHDINILEPMTLLTCAAAVTNRIRLGTSVLLFLFRNPVQLAKTAATLDHLSGGRLTLGISLGGRDFEFGPMGIDRERRVSRFRESLALMRKLWTEDNVTHHGRYYDMDNVTVLPKPVQKPGIPIWFGGSAEGALKRSAELADGWVGGGSGDNDAYRQTWQKVKDYAQAAGKESDSLDSGRLAYVYVDQDREKCRQALVEFTHAYYGPQYDVDNNCVFGSAEECAAKIQGFIDAGAKTMILGPTWPDVEQIERIAREVVPLLK